ncbi:hypothetical protein RvY_13397 [Ramazzottius varieornatus]|uniref:Uncharacterized protein n=1 Tax=Ramazzottius varieornatus TaxID=947166 RepID=A0A1D1VMP7_RAMVA|nr:hypothetical protein RvY_13397 [Ramazzottius varieornatus]
MATQTPFVPYSSRVYQGKAETLAGTTSTSPSLPQLDGNQPAVRSTARIVVDYYNFMMNTDAVLYALPKFTYVTVMVTV